jgi:hypothetical protein
MKLPLTTVHRETEMVHRTGLSLTLTLSGGAWISHLISFAKGARA